VPDGNIIMRAARPLMVLLSNLRITAISQVSGPLMDDVASAIAAFERELRIAGLPDSQTIAAKYTLCATADDIVQNLPGADRQLWTQYSMLSRFFQIRTSGVGFFEELAKMKANPALNCDLLELMHACLSLGFEGQYRTAGGDVALQQIRRDLYQTIRHIRSRPEDEISPHWRGQDIAPEHERVAVPVWAVSAIAAGLLLAVFIALRLLLSSSSGALADRLATLHPDTPVELAREPFSPLPPMPPKSTQLERIRAALAVDIKANRVSVDPAGKDILIKLLDDVLFDRGSATIKSGFAEALKHIAETLNKEPNRILVVGHTDSTALKSTVKFKDNQDLSEKRALAVAEMLRPDLTDHDRIDIAGRGDTEPAASNKTEEGRSRNRRVEIRIPRID
jgi:type VI secretion system protein ImpK